MTPASPGGVTPRMSCMCREGGSTVLAVAWVARSSPQRRPSEATCGSASPLGTSICTRWPTCFRGGRFVDRAAQGGDEPAFLDFREGILFLTALLAVPCVHAVVRPVAPNASSVALASGPSMVVGGGDQLRRAARRPHGCGCAVDGSWRLWGRSHPGSHSGHLLSADGSSDHGRDDRVGGVRTQHHATRRRCRSLVFSGWGSKFSRPQGVGTTSRRSWCRVSRRGCVCMTYRNSSLDMPGRIAHARTVRERAWPRCLGVRRRRGGGLVFGGAEGHPSRVDELAHDSARRRRGRLVGGLFRRTAWVSSAWADARAP